MDEFNGQSLDLVITLCDRSENECPVWLGKGKRIHLPFPDPAKVNGNEDEKMTAFREVRDKIAKGITQLLGQ